MTGRGQAWAHLSKFERSWLPWKSWGPRIYQKSAKSIRESGGKVKCRKILSKIEKTNIRERGKIWLILRESVNSKLFQTKKSRPVKVFDRAYLVFEGVGRFEVSFFTIRTGILSGCFALILLKIKLLSWLDVISRSNLLPSLQS